MDYKEAKKLIYDNIGSGTLIPVANDDIQKGISFIKKKTSCDDQTAKLIWCDLKMDYGTPETNPIFKAREQYKAEESSKKAAEEYKYKNNAECPYCHSKNTKKISGVSKAGSVALWGIFAAGKVSKQWHCNQCKSDF